MTMRTKEGNVVRGSRETFGVPDSPPGSYYCQLDRQFSEDQSSGILALQSTDTPYEAYDSENDIPAIPAIVGRSVSPTEMMAAASQKAKKRHPKEVDAKRKTSREKKKGRPPPREARQETLSDTGGSAATKTTSIHTVPQDVTVVVGGETFAHSSHIIAYASPILSQHLKPGKGGQFRLDLPNSQAYEWRMLTPFLEPHSVQQALVTASNLPMLLPWFQELQLTVLLTECDNLLSSLQLTEACQNRRPGIQPPTDEDLNDLLLLTQICGRCSLPNTWRKCLQNLDSYLYVHPELFCPPLERLQTLCGILRDCATARNALWRTIITYLPDDLPVYTDSDQLVGNPLFPFLWREGLEKANGQLTGRGGKSRPPIRRRESPASRESPSSMRGSPMSHRESPMSIRESPLLHGESPLLHRESPMSHRESPMSMRESPMSIRESPVSNMDKSLDYSISSQTQAALDGTTGESLSMFNESTPSFTSFEQEIMRQQAQSASQEQARGTLQDDLFSQSTAEFNKSCQQFKGTFEAWWKAWDESPNERSIDNKKKPKKTKRQQLLEKAKQAKPGVTPNVARVTPNVARNSPTAEGTVPDNRTVWLESILNRLQQPPIFSPGTDTEDTDTLPLPEAEPAQVSPDPSGPAGRRTFTC